MHFDIFESLAMSELTKHSFKSALKPERHWFGNIKSDFSLTAINMIYLHYGKTC